MRVIAGEFKGRKLKAVPGMNTRPTSDKVKEAVFHMMGPFFRGGTCLDLFAGSGSLGIEALSRGIDHVTFVDKSSQAIKCIYQNLEFIRNTDSNIFRNDAFRAIKIMAKKEMKFNLILLDPPYDKINVNLLLSELCKHELLSIEGMIYVEHRANIQILEDDCFVVWQQKQFNPTTTISILKNK